MSKVRPEDGIFAQAGVGLYLVLVSGVRWTGEGHVSVLRVTHLCVMLHVLVSQT